MKKNMQIVIILIVVAIAIFVVFGFFGIGGLNFFGIPTAAPTQTQTQNQGQSPAQALLAQVQQQGSVSQLEGADITVGTGTPVQAGDTVTVNYIGVLPNGTVFDSSDSHGSSFTFTVGAGQVIKGWDEGLLGMQEGGVRLLAIPPSMAYGATAVGSIPANSTLIFQVQLVKDVPAGSATSTSAAPMIPAQ